MNAWEDIIDAMKARGKTMEPGLSDADVERVESRFEFRFPPDLREFLQTVLPQGSRLPDWRNGEETELRQWLDLPREGIVFDIEHNGFWLPEWGERPAELREAILVAEKLIAAAPQLIPIYQHRMIPDEPHMAGNPVLSVHQTDIIVYGTDLRDYLVHDFMMTEEQQDDWTIPRNVRPIRFWDIDRFQEVRWGPHPGQGCVFDNRRGLLP